MASDRSPLSTERMDAIISVILRLGVGLATLLVFVGGSYYLGRHGAEVAQYHTFRGQPVQLRTIHGILDFALSSHSRGIIEVGLLALIATPIARVIFSLFAFSLQRDRTYVAITLIVLGILLGNLVGGYR